MNCVVRLFCAVVLSIQTGIVLADALPPPSGSFTIAVLPDTQALATNHPAVFSAQIQWIKAHRAAADHNIAYTLHLGDMVNGDSTTQWNNALASMSILDGFVPYAAAPGNHDYVSVPGSRDSRFNNPSYFGPGSPYAAQASIGGFHEAGETVNSWHTFNAGARDWIVMALEFAPRDAVVNWADQIMDAHPNHTGILITHAYTYADDTRYDDGLRGNSQVYRPEQYAFADVNNGQELWDNLVSKHNFALALNGHMLQDGTGRFSAVNPATDGVTHQILQNYQHYTTTANELGNDNGFMRLYEVHPDGKTIHVRTYSPNRDEYLTDSQNDFWIGLVSADGIKASHAAAVQVDAPIAHHQLETTRATDTSENLGTASAALDGTYAGSGPRASDYDGVDDSTTIGPFADLDNWSITAWVRPESDVDSQRVFSNDRPGWNDDLILGITPEGSGLGTSHRWTITHKDDTNAVRTIAEDREDVTANRWYHLAATADGDKLRLYVDGELSAIADRAGADLNFDGDAGAVIGNSFNGSRYFGGSIAELALFDKTITLSDVTEHRMSAFRRVVAANLINHSPTENNNGASTVTAAQHAFPGIELPGGNEGDIRVAIAGRRSLNQREGVLLATVTQNIRDGKRGTVEVARNSFFDGYMALSTTQAGFAGGLNEININTAVAWFPFAGGWTGAHVDGDGTLFAANGVTATEVVRVNAGRYTIALDGVNSLSDGMLFTVGASNEDNIVPTGVRDDGTWDVRVQDNAADFAATGEDDHFSFVYIPYDTANLVGGRYDGLTDSHFNSVGDFTMTRLDMGQYQLTVDGQTPETGMLLLTTSYEALAASIFAPDDSFITYEADGSGNFIINAFDVPGLLARDTQFVWMFTGFSPGQRLASVPEPTTCAIWALGIVGLRWFGRRRHTASEDGDGAVVVYDPSSYEARNGLAPRP